MASSNPRNRQSASRPSQPLNRPPHRGRRLVARFFGGLTTIILLTLLAAIGYTVYLVRTTMAALPATDSLLDYMPGGATEILATDKDPATGRNVVLGRVYTQYKEFAPITAIPQTLQDATISIEDERFYSHAGIDFRGTARAVYRDIAGGRMSEGGSTLTQQLARNVILLSQKKTFNRKLKEAILAIELEKNFSKEQILEMYLNEVCYGNNTFGVKAAAKVYFDKPLNKLTVAEAALIAGLPQSPTEHDPFRHLESAVRRRNDVLAHLTAQHFITPEQDEKALAEKPHLTALKMRHQTEFKAPYFTNYILRQLTAKYGKDEVYKGGLKVYTTLNYEMQLEAERALANGVLAGADDHVSDGALVCLEPRTGFIRAMVGGMDFKKNEYNNVTQGKRQPGSSFKAFVYTTAFMLQPKRFDPDSEVDDSPITYKGNPPYSPKNFEGTFEGRISIRRAFAKSINVAAVKVANAIGIQNVIQTAHSMGITTPLQPNLSLALGSTAVSPLEMASAYAVYPNHGNHANPMGIIRVVDGDGKQLEHNDSQTQTAVIPESVVSEMSSMMRDVVEHGTAAGAKGIHDVPDAHGKTGTTSENRDAWFIGYTPELTTAVWVGGAKRDYKAGKIVRTRYVTMAGVTGGMICAPIWARFMLAAVPIQRKAGEPIQAVPEKTDPSPSAAPRHRRHYTVEPTPNPVDPSTPDNATSTPNPAPTSGAASPQPAQSAPDRGVVPPASGTDNPPTPTPGLPPTAAPTTFIQPTPRPAPLRAVAIAPTPNPETTLADGESTLLPPAPRVQPRQRGRMVTVSVCEDTGLLATAWCPITVTKTMLASAAPHRHCNKHRRSPVIVSGSPLCAPPVATIPRRLPRTNPVSPPFVPVYLAC